MMTTIKDLSSTLILNDGTEMPWFGLGTYLSPNDEITANAVCHAIENGYRMIDTAQSYRNETYVGEGIRKSGRNDVFVVTKVQTENHGYDKTLESVTQSFNRLGLPHIDLFIIHAPFGGHNVETFKALLKAKDQGIVRSVGVSNFGIAHLEGLKQAGLPLPSVNQIEVHPFHRNDTLVKYCKDNNIAVMGYSPLARNEDTTDPDLLNMAQRYKKTLAQVMIRWSLEQGCITIPKSTNFDRILENADVFDFSLSDQDLASLIGKRDFVCGWDPTVSPWEG